MLPGFIHQSINLYPLIFYPFLTTLAIGKVSKYIRLLDQFDLGETARSFRGTHVVEYVEIDSENGVCFWERGILRHSV